MRRFTPPIEAHVVGSTLDWQMNLGEVVGIALFVPAPGKLPLLSIAYWYTAFRMVFTSERRCALRASPSCLVGLIATMTIEARIAMIPMTSRSSMRVNPGRDPAAEREAIREGVRKLKGGEDNLHTL